MKIIFKKEGFLHLEMNFRFRNILRKRERGIIHIYSSRDSKIDEDKKKKEKKRKNGTRRTHFCREEKKPVFQTHVLFSSYAE